MGVSYSGVQFSSSSQWSPLLGRTYLHITLRICRDRFYAQKESSPMLVNFREIIKTWSCCVLPFALSLSLTNDGFSEYVACYLCAHSPHNLLLDLFVVLSLAKGIEDMFLCDVFLHNSFLGKIFLMHPSHISDCAVLFKSRDWKGLYLITRQRWHFLSLKATRWLLHVDEHVTQECTVSMCVCASVLQNYIKITR